MNAILVDAPNAPLTYRDAPDPEPPPHGAVIEVRATGVCRSDWHAWVGHDPSVSFPHVPGHEFAGVVRSVGAEVQAFHGGERVTAPFCCGCGRCATCRSGHQNLCDVEYQPGFDGWGSFAQYVAVPWADVNLVSLPEAVSFEVAAALGCRFMTAYGGLVDKARLAPGEALAVYGCGGVGLSAVMVGVAVGARVVAVDVREEALALARTFGAATCVNARDEDPIGAVRDASDGGAHVAIDALGSADTCAQAVRSVRRRGRHLQLGLLLGDEAAPPVPMFEVIRRELTLLGSHGMQAWRYADMLRFIETRQVPVEALIRARRPLREAHPAMEGMGSFAAEGVTLLIP
ncbi:MAG: alcohol dehydrogenase catalytic domain-containing protein [Trueperaceae bacterium]|nr:alcohol dehydrogenase catalytic domain-containing protein [Trueperaceae bacterium]